MSSITASLPSSSTLETKSFVPVQGLDDDTNDFVNILTTQSVTIEKIPLQPFGETYDRSIDGIVVIRKTTQSRERKDLETKEGKDDFNSRQYDQVEIRTCRLVNINRNVARLSSIFREAMTPLIDDSKAGVVNEIAAFCIPTSYAKIIFDFMEYHYNKFNLDIPENKEIRKLGKADKEGKKAEPRIPTPILHDVFKKETVEGEEKYVEEKGEKVMSTYTEAMSEILDPYDITFMEKFVFGSEGFQEGKFSNLVLMNISMWLGFTYLTQLACSKTGYTNRCVTARYEDPDPILTKMFCPEEFKEYQRSL